MGGASRRLQGPAKRHQEGRQNLVTRDAAAVSDRNPERLRRYLRACAAVSGQCPERKSVYDAAGVDRRTAVAYDDLLEALGVLAPLPAYEANEIKRLTKAPKRHLADPALAGACWAWTQTRYCVTAACWAGCSRRSWRCICERSRLPVRRRAGCSTCARRSTRSILWSSGPTAA